MLLLLVVMLEPLKEEEEEEEASGCRGVAEGDIGYKLLLACFFFFDENNADSGGWYTYVSCLSASVSFGNASIASSSSSPDTFNSG